ncbi:MAG: hypothetical protein A3G93_06165 [Nitrospinae bacterium RIFCSPLOWO2_12_FULL_45_22]|nr:MAG: hypothetical protein A3G93_06165 [Nitrospinae bacterium RIFCSPLOWO2_12_FULL_45_22]
MEERIRAYLKTKMIEADEISIKGLDKMTEGFSYETFSFQAEWVEKGERVSKDFVLRMEPQAGVVEPYDIRPQYWALKLLGKTTVPVPKVYWLEMDPNVLRRPFFVMEKVEGEVPIPWGFQVHECYNDPVKREQMGKNLIEVLAQIHRVDWKALGLDRYLEVPGEGRNPARREIERWENNLRNFRVGSEPVLAEALLWLKENMPVTNKLTIVHGDYRLGNFIWHNDHISAFLDWEMVGIGDPISDLAWLCMRDWSPVDPTKVCNLLEKEDAYKSYQDFTGIEVNEEEVLYWKVLGHFKLAVIIICGVRAYLDKKNPDLRLLTISSTYRSQVEEIINLLNF